MSQESWVEGREWRRAPGWFILCAFSLPALAAPLPEVVARVLEQHPDVRSAAALLRAADAVVWQARSEFLPTVGAQRSLVSSVDRPAGTTSYTGSQIWRSETYLRWTLFNGYADYYGSRAAERTREAAASDLEESREAVALRLAEVYVEVLRLSEQVRLAQEYVEDLRRLVQDVAQRAEAGRIPAVEVDQANSQLIAAESELSQQRAQFAAAGNAFRQLTGMPPMDLSVPALNDGLTAFSLEALQSQAEENSPRLKAARQRIAARDADVGSANASFLPRLSLETRRRISAAPDSNTLSDQASSNALQLNLEVPLGGKQLSRRWEQVEKKAAAEADADAKILQVRTDLGDQYANLTELRYMAPLLKDKTTASYKVVAAYRLQFSAGRRSLLDLLSVRDQLYQSLAQRNGNRFGRIVATARIEHLLGKLRQDLLPGGVR